MKKLQFITIGFLLDWKRFSSIFFYLSVVVIFTIVVICLYINWHWSCNWSCGVGIDSGRKKIVSQIFTRKWNSRIYFRLKNDLLVAHDHDSDIPNHFFIPSKIVMNGRIFSSYHPTEYYFNHSFVMKTLILFVWFFFRRVVLYNKQQQ